MSWQLASTAIVCVLLLCGFAWYERRRPSSKLVALVAALAALATAGRVVFAPIPNVQATTDIALLAGYALGPGPGFAVGAVAALASNFFLGQGPWTPWQMLGWGAVGIAGAALARVSLGRSSMVHARREGSRASARLGLALACALAGFAFGAWMDLFTMVTFAAERSLDSYLAIATASFAFNLAHALGNALLCLMLGPGLLRLLLRFRLRFEVEWRPLPEAATGAAGASAVAVVLAVALLPAPGAEAAGERKAVRYLERAQNADGGFGAAPGQRSSELMTGWAVLGLEAGGRHPLDLRRAGRTPIDFIRAGLSRISDTGELERTMLALRGAGLSARSFAGHALLAKLLSRQRRDGSIEGLVNLTSFGVLALRAAGRPARSAPVRAAGAWLAREQNGDGGFSFSKRGGASDVDDTGAALQALAAAGRRPSAAARRAVAYLRKQQNPDGGFGQLTRSRSNAQSTAWAIQGLVAAGSDPRGFGGNEKRSPPVYLSSLQQADGSFRYSRTSAQTPVWVTAQAIAALRRKAFPLRPVKRTLRRTARLVPAGSRPASPSGDRPSRAGDSRVRQSGAARVGPVKGPVVVDRVASTPRVERESEGGSFPWLVAPPLAALLLICVWLGSRRINALRR